MPDITSTNFLIYLITSFINYIRPIQNASNEQPSINQQIQHNIPRRRRRNRRHFNRYRRINLGNNHIRGCIMLRARQITQQNRLIAAEAEQDLVFAILQAREEIQTISRQIRSVPVVRTQNERPPRPVRNQETEQGSTNSTDTVDE